MNNTQSETLHALIRDNFTLIHNRLDNIEDKVEKNIDKLEVKVAQFDFQEMENMKKDINGFKKLEWRVVGIFSGLVTFVWGLLEFLQHAIIKGIN